MKEVFLDSDGVLPLLDFENNIIVLEDRIYSSYNGAVLANNYYRLNTYYNRFEKLFNEKNIIHGPLEEYVNDSQHFCEFMLKNKCSDIESLLLVFDDIEEYYNWILKISRLPAR